MKRTDQDIRLLLHSYGIKTPHRFSNNWIRNGSGSATAKAYTMQGILKYHGLADPQWRTAFMPSISVNNEKIKNDEVQGLISQRPNNLGRLALYNLARENADSFYTARLDSNLNDINFFEKIISKKQLVQVADYKINFNNWLKKTGEAPVIVDPLKTAKSAERLNKYYETKGYFNNDVRFEIDTAGQKEKRAEVNYNVTTGPTYYLDTITTAIASKDLDSLYKRYKRFSRIRTGQRFDLDNFQAEKERLTSIFANNGIYKFQPNAISFDIERDTTTGQDYKMPVEVDIDNKAFASLIALKEK